MKKQKRKCLDKIMGVFLVKMKNAFVPIERIYSVNTYL